ncbi:MAG: YihY/virulence factor BrkB family protein [Acidimicrobiales bacterium]
MSLAGQAKKILRRIDAIQQRRSVPAVAFAVVKKMGDDNGGNLITMLTYTGFVTVFPLLLLLVTVLGLVFASDPSVRHAILNSTLKQFPVVGNDLGHNVHALRKSSIIGLVISLFGLAYGALGLASSGQYAMQQVWNIPGTERPNFLKRTGRSAAFLGLLAVGIISTTFLTGVGTFGSKQPIGIEIGAIALSVVLNCLQYVAGFRVLTPRSIQAKALLPGAIGAGIGWTVLQSFGNYLVGHTLKGDSATYGTFAIVLGLLAWIYLAARLTIYAAEVNVVLHRRLWPRSLVQPPLTAADRRSLAAQAEQNKRRPEEQVDVSFHTSESGEAAGGAGASGGGRCDA